MSITSFAPAPVFPGGPSRAYIDGLNDGFNTDPSTVAHRIACAYDNADQAWADDYAAGALKGHRDRIEIDEALEDDSLDTFITSQNGSQL